MKSYVKTLEIKVVEYRFDGDAYNYVYNCCGAWVPQIVVYNTYEDAIRAMKGAKAQIANGMSPDIVSKVISVHSVFTGERENDTHQINPNSPFWRKQRHSQKAHTAEVTAEIVLEF